MRTPAATRDGVSGYRRIGRAAFLVAMALVVLPPPAALAAGAPSRIVAVGDVHGDFEQFTSVLREAGVIDKRRRWSGGDATLVQLGDIPDRGPDSRAAMDFLMKLEKQARRKGGAVVALIGNHECMVMAGDLRYTHAGEYESFATSRSEALLDQYYELTVSSIKNNLPEAEWPAFGKAHRETWMAEHPEGYIELRQAFHPTGKYGDWIRGHNTVVRLGRSLFLHGGLSEAMTSFSTQDINEQVREELGDPDSLTNEALVFREDGPLWYRGLAMLPETPENEAMVDRILAAFDADRIVIAHTPRLRAVLPRFNGKVLVVDVGLSAHYGSGHAWLELVDGTPTIVHRGERFSVPRNRDEKLAYLKAIEAIEADPEPVARFIERWLARGEEVGAASAP